MDYATLLLGFFADIIFTIFALLSVAILVGKDH